MGRHGAECSGDPCQQETAFIMVGGSRECKVGCNLEGEAEGLDWKK